VKVFPLLVILLLNERTIIYAILLLTAACENPNLQIRDFKTLFLRTIQMIFFTKFSTEKVLA